jgi:hypothetical protein
MRRLTCSCIRCSSWLRDPLTTRSLVRAADVFVYCLNPVRSAGPHFSTGLDLDSGLPAQTGMSCSGGSRGHAAPAPPPSLVQRWILGTHQGAISHEQLDHYLDEFTFRFNRLALTPPRAALLPAAGGRRGHQSSPPKRPRRRIRCVNRPKAKSASEADRRHTWKNRRRRPVVSA